MLSKTNEALLALIARFQRAEGQALAEYGLLLALIAVVCIVALTDRAGPGDCGHP